MRTFDKLFLNPSHDLKDETLAPIICFFLTHFLTDFQIDTYSDSFLLILVSSNIYKY